MPSMDDTYEPGTRPMTAAQRRKIARAALAVTKAEEGFRETIYTAVRDGYAQREIGAAAGITRQAIALRLAKARREGVEV